jgi:hypothetical protein
MAIYLSLKLKVITTSHGLGNINMLKKSVLVFALLTSITSFSSMASLITVTQVQSYSGTAGDSSVSDSNPGSSVAAFEFLKFDTSLGELTSVNISYSLAISGGSIGVQNNSNGEVSGSGTLGANIELDSDLPFFLMGDFFPEAMFGLFESSENFTFNLAANGSSGDSETFAGVPSTENTGFVTALDSYASNDYLTPFETISAETFNISFVTLSVFSITVPSSNGTFSPVLIDIETSLNYGYTAAVVPPMVGVPEPAVFAFGLLMLCAVTGRKFIK